MGSLILLVFWYQWDYVLTNQEFIFFAGYLRLAMINDSHNEGDKWFLVTSICTQLTTLVAGVFGASLSRLSVFPMAHWDVRRRHRLRLDNKWDSGDGQACQTLGVCQPNPSTGILVIWDLVYLKSR